MTGIIKPEHAQQMFPFLGTLGLIVVLLDGGFEISIDVLRKVATLVAKLDLLTLTITAGLSSVLFNVAFGADPLSPIGFLYGSITCATDPATLIPVFSKLNVPAEISTTLIAESVFNDPLGVVLTKVSMSTLGVGTAHNPILMFLSLAAGGAASGLIAGAALERLLVREPFKEYVVPITIGVALATWYACEDIAPHLTGYELSGFMAVAVLGMYVGNRLTRYEHLRDDLRFLKEFMEELSTVTRIIIFTTLGACVSLPLLKQHWLGGLLCALGNIFVARPIGVLAGTYAPPRENVTINERIYLALEGPRGVVPAALAGTVYTKITGHAHAIPPTITQKMPPHTLAGTILVATFLTILLSVVLEATWARPLSKLLLEERPLEEHRPE